MFFFKQKTAYELRISDWISDVCSSDLGDHREAALALLERDQIVELDEPRRGDGKPRVACALGERIGARPVLRREVAVEVRGAEDILGARFVACGRTSDESHRLFAAVRGEEDEAEIGRAHV